MNHITEEVRVPMTYVIVYMAAAAITGVVMFGMSEQMTDVRRPAAHRLSLSAAAGAVWPLMVLGVAEVSACMLYRRVHRHDEPHLAIVA